MDLPKVRMAMIRPARHEGRVVLQFFGTLLPVIGDDVLNLMGTG